MLSSFLFYLKGGDSMTGGDDSWLKLAKALLEAIIIVKK